MQMPQRVPKKFKTKFPYFDQALCAIDGAHFEITVAKADSERFRNRNTQKAKVTAVNVSLKADESGKMIEAIMDKFGFHLAFNVGPSGKPLARHTVTGYFRHVKLWLLEHHPQNRGKV
ncbi:hypothetical protein Ae201684P_019195 [Aphanomyces euteiches]|nr:hypothetical protein Ae201684P_019195 [Aphanomyces euteiches]